MGQAGGWDVGVLSVPAAGETCKPTTLDDLGDAGERNWVTGGPCKQKLQGQGPPSPNSFIDFYRVGFRRHPPLQALQALASTPRHLIQGTPVTEFTPHTAAGGTSGTLASPTHAALGMVGTTGTPYGGSGIGH